MKKIVNLLKKILKLLNLVFLVRMINDVYHSYQYNKLTKYFDLACNNIDGHSEVENSENIWVFWWQGEKQMPPIVKTCYKSIVKHANVHKVVLVTKDNYKRFTNIDENIVDKLNNKSISITAFSDVLRFNLLKNNGGLWIDATVYVNEDIKEEYFNEIFTIGIDDIYHDSVNGKYSLFLMGGCNNEFISFINNFYVEYFKYNDNVQYYFTTDLALNCCYKNNIGGFKDYVDNNSFNSDPNLHALAPLLNENYDSSTFNKINNRFYKLTYKMDFDDEHDTFYHRIIRNEEPFV